MDEGAQRQHAESLRQQGVQADIGLNDNDQDRQRDDGADRHHFRHRIAARNGLNQRVLQRKHENAQAEAQNAKHHPVLHRRSSEKEPATVSGSGHE